MKINKRYSILICIMMFSLLVSLSSVSADEMITDEMADSPNDDVLSADSGDNDLESLNENDYSGLSGDSMHVAKTGVVSDNATVISPNTGETLGCTQYAVDDTMKAESEIAAVSSCSGRGYSDSYALHSDATLMAGENDNIYVSANGNNANDGLSWETSVKTIEQALSMVSDRGNIYVGEGTYDITSTIAVSKSVNVIGINDNVVLDANNNIRALNITGDNVVLNNITVKNGNSKIGGAVHWSGANGILTNSRFINNKATGTDTATNYEGGGAVYWTGVNGLVANTTFMSNRAAGHGGAIWWNSNDGHLEGCTFENNAASKWAGSVYWKGSNGNIVNVNFTGDSGKNGGSLAIVGADMDIDNIFINSSNSTLGALYWNTANGVIKNSRFHNNCNSGSTGGGAIYTTSTSDITKIENCEFVNNGASKSGGAIYAYGQAVVDNCTFYDNHALEFGGAVFFNKESSEVHNSQFISNNASKSGGAVYISNRFCVVDNSTFKMNSADYAGGVYFSSYKHELTNSIFEENRALVDGGAVYIGSYGTIVNNTRFISNSADRGGALYNYVTGTTVATPTVITCSDFRHNNAAAGGAIASFAKFISIDNVNLTFNKASYGSAIYADRTSYTISDSTLLNNLADSVEMILNFDSDEYSAKAVFKANNTLLNAIYRVEGSILLDNVTYWGIDGISNSDDGYVEDAYAINQNVTLLVSNKMTLETYNITNRTGGEGSAVFRDLSFKPGNYTLQAVHYEDDYYTQISSNIESFSVDGTFSKLKLINDTLLFGENALVEVSPDATGNVSIFIGKYYVAEIKDGLANVSLEGLAPGTYGALIIYSGDDYYDEIRFATQIKIVKNNPGAYSYLTTEYSNTVQAGINNSLTLYVQNIGVVPGRNVKIRVLSEDTMIANFTVENYEVGNYYKFSVTDTVLRPVDNSTVFNVTHNLANYTIIVEDENGLINSTNITFPIVYNGYLGKDYAYPQEFNTKITREYEITGDVMIVNSPYTKYAGSSTTYRVENFTLNYRNDAVEALLYVPYNWDSVEDGDYNRWHAVFNSEFVTPIAHYRDQGNLGGYGNRGYGLVVYNVTEFVKSANNIFELTKVKGGCAVYPSSLIVLTNNSFASSVKQIYISENADLLSKQYSINSAVGELTRLDNIKDELMIKADLYVFAAGAEIDEGNIIFNGNNITNVWNGNSSSLELFKTDITMNINKNNTLFFEATGGAVLSLQKMIVVESQFRKNLNIIGNCEPITVGENATVVVSGLENATGNVAVSVGGSVYSGAIADGVAHIVVPGLTENCTANVSYDGDGRYKDAMTTVDIVVGPKPKVDAVMGVVAPAVVEGESVTVNVTLPDDATGSVIIGNETVPVVNGTASVVLGDLPIGNTTLGVSYSGDDKYNPIETNVTVTVKPLPPKGNLSISAFADPIVVGENATVVVTGLENATGNVTVSVGGSVYSGVIVNGTASVVVPGLAENCTVNVSYAGDDRYNNASAVVDIVVGPKPKVDAVMGVVAPAVVEGESVTVNVTLPDDATGSVSVGNETVPVVNGTASVVLGDLPVGNTTLGLSYSGDDKYNPIETNVTVTVDAKPVDVKENLSISASAKPITVGENATVVVCGLENATGNVTVSVGGSVYSGVIVNGTASVVVPGLAENCTVNVSYAGDDRYNNASAVVDIVVGPKPKVDAVMGVVAPAVVEGESVTVNVTLPDDATGSVSIGNNTVPVVNGTVSIVLGNLSAGNTTLGVSYSGDDKYNPIETNVTVTVKPLPPKGNLTISAGAKPITVGENATVVVYGLENATGNVTVSVGGSVYSGAIVNGTASVVVPGLAENCTVNVSYGGDDRYNNASAVVDIVVGHKSKVNAVVVICVSEISEDGTVSVSVTLPDDATGSIIIGNDSVPVVNGAASAVLGNLSVGNTTLGVSYSGDDKYNPIETEVTVTVNAKPVDIKENLSISASAKPITVGENATVVVSGLNGAAGAVLVDVADNKYYGDISGDKAIVKVIGLNAGKYTAIVMYRGDDNFNGANASVEIEVKAIEAPVELADPGLNVNVSDDGVVAVLPDDATGNITVKIDGGEVASIPLTNGIANVSLGDLDAGNHLVEVIYSGDDKYNNATATAVITKDKIDTVIVVDAKFTRVANDYNAGERGDYFYAILTDVNGNPLANKTVQIAINGPIYFVTTDGQGRAGVKINLASANIYTHALVFQGDKNYNASPLASSKLTLTLKKTSISASGVTFKKSAKKTVSVTLKTTKNPYDGKTYLSAGKKLTLKVNGKTYTAKTNKKGVAKFTIKLTKKGKYAAKIRFDGDRTYKACSKKINVKIK